jgi:hypothetical protein
LATERTRLIGNPAADVFQVAGESRKQLQIGHD